MPAQGLAAPFPRRNNFYDFASRIAIFLFSQFHNQLVINCCASYKNDSSVFETAYSLASDR
jgi:hypothetical protein